MKTLEQAIETAAQHWAEVWDTTPEWIKMKAAQNATVMPERGWRKSRFTDWGRAQMVSRGIRALGRAMAGKPSPQWRAVWMKESPELEELLQKPELSLAESIAAALEIARQP